MWSFAAHDDGFVVRVIDSVPGVCTAGTPVTQGLGSGAGAKKTDLRRPRKTTISNSRETFHTPLSHPRRAPNSLLSLVRDSLTLLR